MFLCLTGFLKQKYKEIKNFELPFDNFSKNIHSFVNLGIYFIVRLKLNKYMYILYIYPWLYNVFLNV